MPEIYEKVEDAGSDAGVIGNACDFGNIQKYYLGKGTRHFFFSSNHSRFRDPVTGTFIPIYTYAPVANEMEF